MRGIGSVQRAACLPATLIGEIGSRTSAVVGCDSLYRAIFSTGVGRLTISSMIVAIVSVQRMARHAHVFVDKR